MARDDITADGGRGGATRHYGLDWLRIAAFGLLILYHIGMVFVPWHWHVKTAQPMDWVAVPMLATNPWRLALLFLVSGYASRTLLGKLGTAGRFARERTARLALPLLVATALFIPPQPWIELVTQHGYTATLGHFWLHDYFRFGTLDGIVLPTWQHLWFVGYLWVYSLVFALAVAVLPPQWIEAGEALAGLPLRPAILLVVLPILLMYLNLWVAWPGRDARHDFVSDLPYHRLYFAMLLTGALLAGRHAPWAAVRAAWPWAAVLAIAAYGYIATLELLWPGRMVVPPALGVGLVLAKPVQAWCAIVALLGLADRYWNVDHPWRATLAEAVFPFYIIHQTIIVVTEFLLLPFAFAPGAEFVALLVATVAGCWLFYALARASGPLRPLLGLKAQPRTRSGQAREQQPLDREKRDE